MKLCKIEPTESFTFLIRTKPAAERAAVATGIKYFEECAEISIDLTFCTISLDMMIPATPINTALSKDTLRGM